MTVTTWRITHRKFSATAFTGIGASIAGGRWNPKRSLMVYTSESMALATLEMRVHIGSAGVLGSYVLIPCTFDSSLMTTFDPATLPHGWTRNQSITRQVGADWLSSGKSAVLRVPSAVVPIGWNYLLSPSHPDFKKVKIGHPVPFLFDTRLK